MVIFFEWVNIFCVGIETLYGINKGLKNPKNLIGQVTIFNINIHI